LVTLEKDGPRCYSLSMTEEQPDSRLEVDEFVANLKSKIPPLEHGALDSRVEELLNDPSADSDDVILILLQEFDPEPNRTGRHHLAT